MLTYYILVYGKCKDNILQTFVTQWTSEAYWTCTAIIFRAHQHSTTHFIGMHRTNTITISSIQI